MNKCSAKTEIYSRVVGFFTPVKQWNPGKKEEFGDRKTYVVAEKAEKTCPVVMSSDKEKQSQV